MEAEVTEHTPKGSHGWRPTRPEDEMGGRGFVVETKGASSTRHFLSVLSTYLSTSLWFFINMSRAFEGVVRENSRNGFYWKGSSDVSPVGRQVSGVLDSSDDWVPEEDLGHYRDPETPGRDDLRGPWGDGPRWEGMMGVMGSGGCRENEDERCL